MLIMGIYAQTLELSTNLKLCTIPSVVVRYSDGNDYSHLKVNSEEHPEHSECVMCGSTEVTITDDADICHEPDCRYVYI